MGDDDAYDDDDAESAASRNPSLNCTTEEWWFRRLIFLLWHGKFVSGYISLPPALHHIPLIISHVPWSTFAWCADECDELPDRQV